MLLCEISVLPPRRWRDSGRYFEICCGVAAVRGGSGAATYLAIPSRRDTDSPENLYGTAAPLIRFLGITAVRQRRIFSRDGHLCWLVHTMPIKHQHGSTNKKYLLYPKLPIHQMCPKLVQSKIFGQYWLIKCIVEIERLQIKNSQSTESNHN